MKNLLTYSVSLCTLVVLVVYVLRKTVGETEDIQSCTYGSMRVLSNWTLDEKTCSLVKDGEPNTWIKIRSISSIEPKEFEVNVKDMSKYFQTSDYSCYIRRATGNFVIFSKKKFIEGTIPLLVPGKNGKDELFWHLRNSFYPGGREAAKRGL